MKEAKTTKTASSPYERHYSIPKNIVWCFRFYRKQVPFFLWLALAEILVGAAMPYIRIYLPKVALDLVTGGADIGQLVWKLGGLGLLFMLLQALYEGVSEGKYYLYNIRRRDLMSGLFLKSLRVRYRDTERKEVRELYQKGIEGMAMGDNSSLYRITYGTLDIVQNIISFMLYSTVLGILNPLMVVSLLALSLVQYALNFSKIKCLERFRASDADLGRRRRYLSSRVMGDVKAAKEIRIFGMRAWLNGLLDKVFAELKKQEKTKRRSESLYVQVNGALTVIRDAGAYAYLIWQVFRGTIGAGDFVLYFGAITGFSGFVESIIASVGMLRMGSNDLNYYRAYLELPEDALGSVAAEETLEGMLLGEKTGSGVQKAARHIGELTRPIEITFQDVSFSYADGEADPSGQVFRHFNLTIRGGEKIALVGVNGAGKTTFVKLLCGIYEPQEGRILLNGIDRREFPRAEVYQLFSAVFQEKFLPPFTVGDSVSLQKDWSRERVWKALEDAGLKDFFTERGYSPDSYYGKEIDEEGMELSGGQEQRFLLARALYKDAPVLVLDEPTAALDPIAESEVYDSYLKFSKDKTAVFISHRLASTRFSDRILLLEGGRVVEEGTHQELLDRGQKYAEMFQVQSSYYAKAAREREAFS
ncbi:MAG: ABC transporter ATP-binding protein/permease [Lachnospiraceae bacterium]|nr:ABC transporter ATP-binding protein/permease [Lachnospiraceae bacterium]MCM1304707.1 ABC transporter ATP-binding protein/permease [Butyrivibrio sp.]MCM1345000.1 ABC transporter ATP-binding protein/permease [Muribaculaceae bacterium]MCM1240773.1 ABC transporter ATP-binding protein/permease [Lachnospiraceae bacterium]MCM1240812.1 ABC transporter ATP-binding protein/permease [Lachnospiraceae bacterium]